MTMLMLVIIYVNALAGIYAAECDSEFVEVIVEATLSDTTGVFFLDCDASEFGDVIPGDDEYAGPPEACEALRYGVIP